MEPRINLITLGVGELTRSIGFYEALGLPRFQYESDNIAFFELNGSWLALYPKEALADDVGLSTQGSGFCGVTLAHNVTSREAVDRVMSAALRVGAQLVKPAQEAFWGGYSGYFADPDGFIWEVAHVPQFWIGPKPEDET
ncbi:MAG: glyoxalase [gamma proteobacterium symbiont of Ctena orbiculata]|nr:VOC family protein [Candidatus Thiodiazotropha taylori]PUB85410.1 MAG: glyoxalase [gamma proteobacterium symbiont of Ctena orbiculata]MBT2995249.1 VOC family protein [Candidatus Thiodiazotropha taylori]MBT2999832.1 VOC family protein [Candidatus Thiodiazotropha taylori]MBT3028720.1 VOC family protein [Candidatus Thiodiazotropha taylori]